MGDTPLAREEFPIVDHFVYLDHAGSAPLPRGAVQVMHEVHEAIMNDGRRAYHRAAREAEEIREAAAMLLGAATTDVCFVKNTTEGIGFVANGLDWTPGDRVVVARHEFPSNLWPWLELEARGVEVALVDPTGPGEGVTVDRYAEAIGEGARLLAVSWVQYRRGWRSDLEELGALCRERDVLLCVDAMQGLGCLPARMSGWGVDFAAAGGYKWLLGPQGSGLFYVSPRGRDLLRALEPGWHSPAATVLDEGLPAEPSARRFEGGALDLAAIAGLGTSVQLIIDAGVERVWSHIEELTALAARRLVNLGATILTDRTVDVRSGIVNFSLPGTDPKKAAGELAERGVICGTRGDGIRISPHGYNAAEDIEKLAEAVAGVLELDVSDLAPTPSIQQGPMRRPADW